VFVDKEIWGRITGNELLGIIYLYHEVTGVASIRSNGTFL
jgi:hypothetical protein